MPDPGEITEDLTAYVPVDLPAFKRMRGDLAKAKGDRLRQFLILKLARDAGMHPHDMEVALATWPQATASTGPDLVADKLGPDWAKRNARATAAREKQKAADAAAAPKVSAIDRMTEMVRGMRERARARRS